MNDQDNQTAVGFSSEDQELLSYFLEDEGLDSQLHQPISRRERRDRAPLSYSQQRLWFLDQLQTALPVYNNASAVRLRGKLNVSALERSLREIVRRHESLRTTFAMEETQPAQFIHETQSIDLALIDLTHLPPDEREKEARRLATVEARRPFDLARGPLLRSTLLRLTENEHIALLLVHHIVSDAWSMDIMLNELTALYEVFCAGQESPLRDLHLQYADYAVWQRESVREDLLTPRLAYWREHLADMPKILELPTDRPRPPVQSFLGAKEGLKLSSSLLSELKTLSLRHNATLFMTLLAAFLTLLARYTQQTDLTVGTPISGRRYLELEKLIGFFVNTSVLRVDLSGDPTFEEVLARVKSVVLDAHAHEVPFEKLIDELQPERSLSYQALFQVMFGLQNASSPGLDLEGLRTESYPVEGEASRFDLTLSMTETPETLHGSLEYSTDLFDATTAVRLLKTFKTLLYRIVANPQQRISQFSLLTYKERDELLSEWNASKPIDLRAICLHDLFEEQVEHTPDAVALSFENEQITYSELNRRANQVAHYLQKRGVGADSLVGLCVERSIELVIGILGIVKAGGAYVPLDPTYPQKSLSFMLEDAQLRVLITQHSLLETLPAHSAEMVCLDTDWERIKQGPEHNPDGVSGPENLAYVIYTSGSMGQPKGVAVTQSNVLRLFAATQAWYGFNERDVWTLFHSYAFDFSVWELWGALLHGGRLVIVPFLVSRTPEAFYQLLVKEGVTVLNQTPSAFRQLMRAEETFSADGESLALRLIIFGGEALELRNLQKWYQRHPECRPQLVNMYGITETTVHVTYRPLRAVDADECSGSMIGCRIPDLQTFILDKHMQPVPIGVPGELYVGGDGLARGYLGHAMLTAERFGPHPFSTIPGGRLYRTGDRARYLTDGDIEYLGRADEQVKIRGFRIELGEIETVLRQHEAVNEVAVVAREDVVGERRLVAYVVTAETHAITTKLRNYLQERLPEYMIPSAFIPMSQLPMTPHGKLDRRALPAPGVDRPELERAYVEPRNEVEETLAAIWAKALGVERVGIHDNFFELGGDSILSVRVLAMAKDTGINFSLQQLFQSQTIGALAVQLNLSEIEAAPVQSGGPFSLLTEADRAKLPDDVEDAYPLAMLQAGMLYHMVYSPGAMIYHNVYSYHLRARLEIETFRQAVQRVVDRHAILRTSFDLSAYSEPLQLVHRNTTFPVEVDDLRQIAIEEQESLLDEFVESEKQRRFDYSRPPLLRFHIHHRAEDSFNFTLTECHPILDGWSLHSLLAEIFTSYFDALNGRSTPASPLSSSYREFVRRERLALASEECRLYWQEKLRNISATELPRWRSTFAKTGPRILKRNYPLSIETSKALKTLARSLSVPLKSVLLAAHLKALSVVCGRSDVVTGLVSTGRLEETDGDKTIGLFFNTLPFHANIAGGSWRDLIAATFKAELELLPYRRYPIAALQNQWGRKPLFETVFNYLHFHVLNDLVRSGDLEILGPIRSWEETNLTLSTAFVLPPLSEQIILNLRFDTTQFSDDQIESISGYYTRILDLMLSDPYGRHEVQSFLADDEMQKLLKEWNRVPANHSDERCIHQLFDEQAEKTPDTVAVICEGERLTYRELNEQANRLARYLLTQGIGPEVPVAICLERSVETVVCILGVLKAGGAYVPIEPEHASQRIGAMLEEAGVPLLLTQRKLIASLPVNQVMVMCVDVSWEDSTQVDEPNCIDNVFSGTLAYLMFTSGSTGRPKAVAVEHRQLVNYVRGISERLQLSGIANYALASTFATDLGHTAIFPPLVTGGTLHVLSSERLANPEAVAEYFELHCIDFLKIVPTHLAALLESLPARKILPRRRLILGGDVCRRDLVERVNSLAPDCVVFNHYGPTETTVGALTYRFEPEHKADLAETVPLGHPLPGAEIYLLDACMNPVPAGTPGELYIGGEGLARGYFNQPGLTAERFVPHSFSKEVGTRLYRTGDMGRYLPDGSVEFLGRHDHQVKIRGYRIELGEVEAVLCQHPAISQAVAMIDHEEQQYDRRIVAYVVTQTGPTPTQSELRRHMREKLPEYSVPSAFVLLHELPLTASGKIDRKALPQATMVALKSDVSYIAPRDETERIIAAIWRDSLKVERMSVHDNFFDLGGHSLVVLQVQSKLREVLQKDIPIVAMFEHPTISSLATYLNTVASEEKPFAKAQEEAAARRAMLTERSRFNANAAHH